MVDIANKDELMRDALTGLGNEKYLREQYSNYCATHEESKLIMFDFTSFKKINDTFGHDEGDKCLITFARLLESFFKNSLLIRLHGDEFVVVTSHSDERIQKLLSVIDSSIALDVDREVLKYKFSFNSGSCACEEDLATTLQKADCMMYYAKKNKDSYQSFDEDVYQQKIEKDALNETFNNMLLSGDFTYYGRKMFTLEGAKTKYMQVYTKDKEGNSFLTSKLYSSIRNNTTIKKFDLHNLQRLVEKSSMSYTHSKYFINIDYKSLLSIKEQIPFFERLKESTYNGLNNVILSIDLTGIESVEYDMTLDIIELLGKLGFKIKLDKVSNKIADYFVSSANPNFIKLAVDEWKNIEISSRQYKILSSRISTYKLYGTKPIMLFDQVETINEVEFIRDICGDALASGNYYSRERRLRI